MPRTCDNCEISHICGWKNFFHGDCDSWIGWIPVEEELPEYGKEVLIVNDDGIQSVALRSETSIHYNEWEIKYCLYDSDSWDDDEQGVIVAWRELPKWEGSKE